MQESRQIPTHRHEVRVHARPEAVIVPILLVTMFVLLGAWLIAFEHVPSRVFYDQELYHRPTIDQFFRQWPDFDFWHYLSATTPGYHVLMAGVARFISPSIFALQIASLTIGAALVWTLSRAVARRTAGPLAAALCLPFMFSPYVLDSAAWLLPDNLGWLGVLSILLIALRPRLTARDMALGGAILLALVLVRQIQLWTAGLLWAAAWLTAQENGPEGAPALQTLGGALMSDLKSQTSRGLLCLLCTLPAVALFGLFFRYWGGPVPPVFQQHFHTYNAAAGAFILAIFGAWGLFFSPIWAPHLLRFWRTRRAGLLAVVGAGVAVVLLVPTNPDFDSGRRTGLWNIAERFPVLANHTSPVVAGLAMLGILTVAALAFAAPMRQRLIFLAAIAGFALANTTNNDLFQRYVDPFVLMLLALMSATAAKVMTEATDGPDSTTTMYKAPAPSRLPALGPCVLALFLSAVTIRSTIRRDAEGKPDYSMIHDPPPLSRSPSAHDDPSKPAPRPPPCDLPPPPKPPGKHFWPWA